MHSLAWCSALIQDTTVACTTAIVALVLVNHACIHCYLQLHKQLLCITLWHYELYVWLGGLKMFVGSDIRNHLGILQLVYRASWGV